MQFKIDKQRFNFTPEVLLRRAGYHRLFSRRSGKISYVRRLGNFDYPRFHLYLAEDDGHLIFNLHLDQKAPSYSGARAHSADYDTDLIATEIKRIQQLINSWPQSVIDNDVWRL